MASTAHSNPGRVHENPSNPYLQSNPRSFNFSRPPGQVTMLNQPVVNQYPQMNSPQPQSTIYVANSATANSDLFFKEGKALGAVQIMIGLIHIGLGIILGLLFKYNDFQIGYLSYSLVGGYPFWGGISYICSGSLSVSATRNPIPCLVKSTLGMNIVSAIFSVVGIILLIVDMFINGELIFQNYWARVTGQGISAILFIFSILELSITSKTSNFLTTTIMKNDLPVMVIPNVYTANSYNSTISTTIQPPRMAI